MIKYYMANTSYSFMAVIFHLLAFAPLNPLVNIPYELSMFLRHQTMNCLKSEVKIKNLNDKDIENAKNSSFQSRSNSL